MKDIGGNLPRVSGRFAAHLPNPLVPGISIRLLAGADAALLAEAYVRNRGHLAPWEPEREEAFFTPSRQMDIIRAKRA